MGHGAIEKEDGKAEDRWAARVLCTLWHLHDSVDVPGSVLGTGTSSLRGDPSLQSLTTNAGERCQYASPADGKH